jgi:hypothetical protein
MTRTAVVDLGYASLLFLGAGLVGLILLIVLFKLKVLAGLNVLFYRGLALIALSTLIVLALSLWVAIRVHIPLSVALAAAAISASVNLTVLIVLPVTVDRSVTVFLLGYMDQHANKTFTTGELRAAFEDIYLGRWDQTQRRMDEQQLSGNVAPTKDGYRITPQGRSFVAFSRKVAWAFDTDPRFVSPEKPR